MANDPAHVLGHLAGVGGHKPLGAVVRTGGRHRGSGAGRAGLGQVGGVVSGGGGVDDLRALLIARLEGLRLGLEEISAAHTALVEALKGRQAPALLTYTPSEVAEVLGLGRSKVYELMDSGALAYSQVGPRKRLVRRAAVEAYLTRRG